GDVHVGRREIGAAPHFGGGVRCCHLGVVGSLVPAPEPERPPTGFDANGVVAVGGGGRGGDHEGDGAVDGDVAVHEPERIRDRAGREVLVHGQRITVCRTRIQRGVASTVDGQP